MNYVKFLSDLFERGSIIVSRDDPTVSELQAGDELLASYEQAWRSTLPSVAPQFVPATGQAAALAFFRACQFTVYRDLSTETLQHLLPELLSQLKTPATCYSVDVVLHYLPDLVKLATTLAQDDPLVEHLKLWAKDWPLSSVGMNVGEVDITPFANDDCLMQLYIDRIIAVNDTSRLVDSRVRDRVKSALGIFPQLNERLQQTILQHEALES